MHSGQPQRVGLCSLLGRSLLVASFGPQGSARVCVLSLVLLCSAGLAGSLVLEVGLNLLGLETASTLMCGSGTCICVSYMLCPVPVGLARPCSGACRFLSSWQQSRQRCADWLAGWLQCVPVTKRAGCLSALRSRHTVACLVDHQQQQRPQSGVLCGRVALAP